MVGTLFLIADICLFSIGEMELMGGVGMVGEGDGGEVEVRGRIDVVGDKVLVADGSSLEL